MPRLEVIYDGALDDVLDAWIAREANVRPASRSYSITACRRNLQFNMATTADADAAARKIRAYRGRVLHTYVHE